MSLPDRIYGFDGAGDDTTVVVMQRRPGEDWQVESIYPDRGGRVVARIGAPPDAPAIQQTAFAWTEEVAKWMTEAGKLTFTLTEEQRDLLARTFSRLHAEGHLTFRH